MFGAFTTRNGRGFKSALEIPSFVDPAPKERAGKSVESSPFGNRPRHSLKSEVDVGRAICPLLNGRGPSAVAWLVVAVIVDSVKRVGLARASSNVGDKVCKRLIPALANPNSSSSVSVKMGTLGVVAPGAHGIPDVKLW